MGDMVHVTVDRKVRSVCFDEFVIDVLVVTVRRGYMYMYINKSVSK